MLTTALVLPTHTPSVTVAVIVALVQSPPSIAREAKLVAEERFDTTSTQLGSEDLRLTRPSPRMSLSTPSLISTSARLTPPCSAAVAPLSAPDRAKLPGGAMLR